MAKKSKLTYVLAAIFLVFPFGQLEKLPLGMENINIYLHDILITIFVICSFFRNKKEIHLTKTAKAFLPFILIACFSFLINIARWGVEGSLLGFLYLVRWVLYFLFYVFISNLASKEKWKEIIKKAILVCIVTSIIIGFFQYLFCPDLIFLKYFGWDPHYFRLTGSWLDSGFSGLIYLLFLIYLYEKYRGKTVNLKKILLLLGTYLSLALTYSRSSFTAFFVVSIIYSLKLKNIKYGLFSFLILLTTIYFLPRKSTVSTRLERKDTIYARIENWQDSLKIIEKSPIYGVGFNNYRLAQNEHLDKEVSLDSHSGSGADSSLLFVLATTGILGLTAFLYLLYGIIKSGNHLMVATITAIITHSFFNNSLFYSWVIIWWFTIIALERKN